MDRAIALTYIKRKRRKKIAAIVAGISSIVLAVFIIIAFNLFYVDRFTITTNNESNLCLTLDKENYTTILAAPPLLNASDTQYFDIMENENSEEKLDLEGTGSKNSDHYFAYSFYLGGQGDVPSVNYNLSVSLLRYSNNIEEAMRIMIIRNNDMPVIYSKPLENGSGKPIYQGEAHNEETKIDTGKVTKPFRLNKNIIVEAYEVKPGKFDKYTIVMWIDGWESVNEMKGGIFSANIKFSTHSIN